MYRPSFKYHNVFYCPVAGFMNQVFIPKDNYNVNLEFIRLSQTEYSKFVTS